jgi:adenine-specific DNA-methyltransferase
MKGSLDSAAPLIRENQDYLSRQVITYIGNKRNLIGFIGRGLEEIRKRLGKSSLKTFDVFSGSGIVARYLKSYSEKLVVNDMELYSEVINRCYLADRSDVPMADLRQMHAGLIESLREENLRDGFIRDLYAGETPGSWRKRWEQPKRWMSPTWTRRTTSIPTDPTTLCST